MAQTSLDGFWKTTQKSNGLTIKETLCFEGEFSLKDNKLVITWNPSTMTADSMYTASVKQSFDAIVVGAKINITNNSTDTYNVVAIEKGK